MDNMKEYLIERKIMPRSSFKTLVLSLVPGAAHMYLGLMGKGIIIMASFSFLTFFIGWLALSMFGFLLPVIWFYSFFDANNLKHEAYGMDVDLSKLLNLKFEINLGNKFGYILIFIGLLIFCQRLLMPIIRQYLNWEIIGAMQTIFVALVFVLGGVYIINKNKAYGDEDDEEN